MGILSEYKGLLDRVRLYQSERGLSLRAFARLAEVPPSTLVGMHSEAWTPSGSVLVKVLDAMDRSGEASAPSVDVDAMTQGVSVAWAKDGRCVERVFKPNAIGQIGPSELAQSQRLLRRRHRSHSAAIQIAKGVSPGAAVHLFDAIGDDAQNFRITRWDGSSGFDGGRDYTGQRLGDAPDSAYLQHLCAAYMSTRELRAERFSFVHRRGPDGLRTFFRLLKPLKGVDGRPQILCVTLPEKPDASRHLIPDRFRV